MATADIGEVGQPINSWQPSAIQIAEVELAGTEKPVIHHPGEVSNEDFTLLWNRVVVMDRAVLEMIDEFRKMRTSLDQARAALTAKEGIIDGLTTQIGVLQIEVQQYRERIVDHDDRINWLET